MAWQTNDQLGSLEISPKIIRNNSWTGCSATQMKCLTNHVYRFITLVASLPAVTGNLFFGLSVETIPVGILLFQLFSHNDLDILVMHKASFLDCSLFGVFFARNTFGVFLN